MAKGELKASKSKMICFAFEKKNFTTFSFSAPVLPTLFF